MSGLLGIHQRAYNGNAGNSRSESVFDAADAVNAESTVPRYPYRPRVTCAAKGFCARADAMSLSQQSPMYRISLPANGISPRDVS
jgi:hypothetical protein